MGLREFSFVALALTGGLGSVTGTVTGLATVGAQYGFGFAALALTGDLGSVIGAVTGLAAVGAQYELGEVSYLSSGSSRSSSLIVV